MKDVVLNKTPLRIMLLILLMSSGAVSIRGRSAQLREVPILKPSASKLATPSVPATRMLESSIRRVVARDNQNLWAVGERRGARGDVGVLLRSSDAGKSWRLVFSSSTLRFDEIQFSRSEAAWLIATTRDHKGVILKSQNGGFKWSAPLLSVDDPIMSACFLNDLDAWVLTIEGLLLRTTDGGAHWTESSGFHAQKGLAVEFSDRSHGWIVGENSQLYESTDGGLRWRNRGTDLVKLLSHFGLSEIDFESVHFQTAQVGMIGAQFLVPRMINNQKVFDFHGVVFLTQDCGKTWRAQIATKDLGLSSTLFLNEESILVLPSRTWHEGVMLRSLDAGETWTKVSIPSLGNGLAYGMQFVDKNNGWLLFDNGDHLVSLYRTTNGGAVWERLEASAPALYK